MVWNKSGYRDNFSKQQLVLMDQKEKANQQREKESAERKRAEDEVDALENKILEYLGKERTELSLQEISKGIGEENETNVLKVLNNISRKKIELIVSALDATNSTSTRYKSIT